MIPESRDDDGRLEVAYFVALAWEFKVENGYYDQTEFKERVKKSGVLKPEDWLPDGSHPYTWRHRVERATQGINTGFRTLPPPLMD